MIIAFGGSVRNGLSGRGFLGGRGLERELIEELWTKALVGSGRKLLSGSESPSEPNHVGSLSSAYIAWFVLLRIAKGSKS
jgi:hypothetical protein